MSETVSKSFAPISVNDVYVSPEPNPVVILTDLFELGGKYSGVGDAERVRILILEVPPGSFSPQGRQVERLVDDHSGQPVDLGLQLDHFRKNGDSVVRSQRQHVGQ